MKHSNLLKRMDAIFVIVFLGSLINLMSQVLPAFAASLENYEVQYLDDQVETVNSLPIPEPTTFVLFITGCGFLGYYGWRQRIRHAASRSQIAFINIPFHQQFPQNKQIMMIGEMTCEVIHDIKNILTGIKTCAEVLTMDELPDEERKEFAQLVLQEITRALNLSQEVLDFSYGGEKNLSIQPASVENIIHESLSPLKETFLKQNIEVKTELHYSGSIRIDIEKMKRVCMNIFKNAIEAMPRGGTLTIESQLVYDTVVLEFRDTGCGMSQELQSQIFEPFVTEGKTHGTGLGMAIAKTIVNAHGAEIDVQSEIGLGTTIRILLPYDNVSSL